MKTKKNFKTWFLKEAPAILIAFCIATLLWFFNQVRQTEERTFQIAPTIKISDILTLVKEPNNIAVKVKGDSTQLRNVDPNDLGIIIDLSNVTTEGEHEAQIVLEKKGMARHLQGVEFSFFPISMRVAVETKVTKAIPILVQTKGSVKAGYEAEAGVPAPSFISVTGPRSEIEKLEYVYTELISLDELTKNIDQNSKTTIIDKVVNLQPIGDGSTIFNYNRSQEIFYSFRVQEVIKQVTVENIFVNQIGTSPDFNYKLDNEYVSLRLSGPELILNKLDVNDLIVGIELDSISREGNYTLPVQRMFSSKIGEDLARVTDLGLYPQRINVTVTRK